MEAKKLSQPAPTTSADGGIADEISVQQIEAARYAVLRRLSPSLRHHMVRPLQPIGLIYGVMHHKLSADVPDLQGVRADAEKINDFSKAALVECANIGSWMAPEPGDVTDLASGVTESVGLMATMLHFCGFRLVNVVSDMAALVNQDALRMVLNAAILEVTDWLDEPATLTISASATADKATVVLNICKIEVGSVDRYDDGYRKLVWADVQALAFAEHVSVSRVPDQVTLSFTVLEPTSAN